MIIIRWAVFPVLLIINEWKELSGLYLPMCFSSVTMQSDKTSERVQAESQTGKIRPEILSDP